MADDIDIEEHDVFEHPTIRAAFPDLSIVKPEIFEQTSNESNNIEKENGINDYDTAETTASVDDCNRDEHFNDFVPPQEDHLNDDNENTEESQDLLVENFFNCYIPVESDEPNTSPTNTSKANITPNTRRQIAVKSTSKLNIDIKPSVGNTSQVPMTGRNLTSILIPTPIPKTTPDLKPTLIPKPTRIPKTLDSKSTVLKGISSPKTIPVPKLTPVPKTTTDSKSITVPKTIPVLRNVPAAKSTFSEKPTLSSKPVSKTIAMPRTTPKRKSIPVRKSSSVSDTAQIKPKSKFACEKCNKQCASLEALVEHLYEHFGEKIHNCIFCKETFAQKKDLEEHLWTHAMSRASKINLATSTPKTTASSAKNVAGEKHLPPSASKVTPLANPRVTPLRLSAANSRMITKCLQSFSSSPFNSSSSDNVSSEVNSKKGKNVGYAPIFTKFRHSSDRSMPNTSNREPSGSSGSILIECQKCGICFTTEKSYFQHQKVIHKEIVTFVPPNIKSNIVFPRKCKFCNKILVEFLTYNSHIMQVHLRNHGKSNNKSQTKSSDMEVKYFYKCRACNISFPNYKCGYRHKVANGAEHVISRNFEKFLLKKKSVDFKPSLPESGAKNSFHPSGLDPEVHLTLYQCSICKSHSSKIGMSVHKSVKSCQSTRYYVCTICGISFVNKFFVKAHRRVHERSKVSLSAQDFIIKNFDERPIILELRTVVQRLPKCEMCGFSFKHFKDVLRHGCSKTKGKKCKPCDAVYNGPTYKWHLSLHKLLCKKPISKLPPKLIKKEHTEPEAPSTSNELNKLQVEDFTLFRCGKCKIHLSMDKNEKINHRKSNCLKLSIYVCTECGLTFTKSGIKAHRDLHNRSEISLTYDSFQIFILDQNKRVGLEKCRYAQCTKCYLNHEGGLCWLSHINYKNCSDDPQPRVPCIKCKMVFSATAYKLHLPYYGCDTETTFSDNVKSITNKLGTSKAISKNSDTEKSIPSNEDTKKVISKMIKKYNEMTDAWSQLYLCRDCGVLVDSYDEVVRHCEEHLKHTFKNDLITKECHICELIFEDMSFDRHMQHHLSESMLQRNNFDIIDYEASQYGSKNWNKGYFTNKNFEIKLKQDGPKEHTLYQCRKCNIFFESKLFAFGHSSHVRQCNLKPFSCNICKLKFHYKHLQSHKLYHEKYANLTAKSFRILTFIRTRGLANKFNGKIESKGKYKITESTRSEEKPDLYKCIKCKVHFVDKRAASKHSSSGCKGPNHSFRAARVNCKKCKRKFTENQLTLHMKVHHANKKVNLNVENFHIIIKSSPQNIDKQPTIEKSYKANNNVDKNTRGVSINIVSKNKLILGGNNKPIEVCKKGRNNNSINKQNVSVDNYKTKTIKLHRCVGCKVSYFDIRPFTLKRHVGPHKKNNATKCDTCGLMFSNVAIKSHRLTHFSTNIQNYKILDIKSYYKTEGEGNTIGHKIIGVTSTDSENLSKKTEIKSSLHPKKITSSPSLPKGNYKRKMQNLLRMYKNRLYRCMICNLHYLQKRSVQKHILSHDSYSERMADNCTDCGFKFPKVTLKLHKDLHHIYSQTTEYQIIGLSPGKYFQGIELDVVKVALKKKKVRLYKCKKCEVHYQKADTLKNHLVNHVAAPRVADCDKCGLLFSIKSLTIHNKMHHGVMNLGVGDFEIIEMSERKVDPCEVVVKDSETLKGNAEDGSTEIDTQLKDNKTTYNNIQANTDNDKDITNNSKNIIYRCSTCEINYVSRETLNKHIDYHIRVPKHTANCKICNFRFSKISLAKHIQIKHKSKKDFIIVERRHNDRKGKGGYSGYAIISTEEIGKEKNCASESAEMSTVELGKGKVGYSESAEISTAELGKLNGCDSKSAEISTVIHEKGNVDDSESAEISTVEFGNGNDHDSESGEISVGDSETVEMTTVELEKGNIGNSESAKIGTVEIGKGNGCDSESAKISTVKLEQGNIDNPDFAEISTVELRKGNDCDSQSAEISTVELGKGNVGDSDSAEISTVELGKGNSCDSESAKISTVKLGKGNVGDPDFTEISTVELEEGNGCNSESAEICTVELGKGNDGDSESAIISTALGKGKVGESESAEISTEELVISESTIDKNTEGLDDRTES